MTLYLKKSGSWRKNHLARSAIVRNIIILIADEHVCGLPVGFYANQPN
jgi:hypothetical protein